MWEEIPASGDGSGHQVRVFLLCCWKLCEEISKASNKGTKVKGISRLCVVLIMVPSTSPSHLIERVLFSSFNVAFKLFPSLPTVIFE